MSPLSYINITRLSDTLSEISPKFAGNHRFHISFAGNPQKNRKPGRIDYTA